VLGVFWRRGTKQAAMTTLIFNLLIGIIYLCIDIPLIGSRQIVTEDWGIPFMMVGVILCATCIVIYVIVSLLTPRPSDEQLKDLCWEHPLESICTGAVKSVTDPRIMAGILFVLMIVLYCLIG
jgi:SSS family solute:Na+ symporter